jgi:hypothetical protein
VSCTCALHYIGYLTKNYVAAQYMHISSCMAVFNVTAFHYSFTVPSETVFNIKLLL